MEWFYCVFVSWGFSWLLDFYVLKQIDLRNFFYDLIFIFKNTNCPKKLNFKFWKKSPPPKACVADCTFEFFVAASSRPIIQHTTIIGHPDYDNIKVNKHLPEQCSFCSIIVA